ncbi:MAG: hypothetical protein U0R19_11395 [Bryobacteraceae bacterium]
MVTVDSQLPGMVDAAPDPLAGQKFIVALRMQGLRCRVFWHSGVPLDQDFRDDLAVESAPETGLTHVTGETRPLPADIQYRARRYESQLRYRRIEHFNSLLVAMQAYLFVRDMESAKNRIAAPFNLVLEELGVDAAHEVFTHHEHAWSWLRERLQNTWWWFAGPVRTALAAWRPEALSLAAFCKEFRPSPALASVFDSAILGPERWLKYSALCARTAGDAEATPACVYQGAIQQLWQFCSLVQQRPECALEAMNVDATYRALQLIALLHYPFIKGRNLADRSVLSHQDLSTQLRVLFQRPGLTETDGGNPVRTGNVLTGKVPKGTYPEIDEALDRWPTARSRIQENIRSIATNIDPFCGFLHDIESEFHWQWHAVVDLHAACINNWLGIKEWASRAANALQEFDCGLELVKKGELSMDQLLSRYEALREVYSGRAFFNFQQTT